jgi:hypothetical protein
MWDIHTVDSNIRRFEGLLDSDIGPDQRKVVERQLHAEREGLARRNAGAVDPSRLFRGLRRGCVRDET